MALPHPLPCPHCGSLGALNPLTLMEAIGCDRCQTWFSLNPDTDILEQIASATPAPRRWRWSGHRWQRLAPTHQSPWFLGATLLITLTLLWMPLLLNQAVPGLAPLWIVVFLGVVVLPGIMVWIAYRR